MQARTPTPRTLPSQGPPWSLAPPGVNRSICARLSFVDTVRSPPSPSGVTGPPLGLRARPRVRPAWAWRHSLGRSSQVQCPVQRGSIDPARSHVPHCKVAAEDGGEAQRRSRSGHCNVTPEQRSSREDTAGTTGTASTASLFSSRPRPSKSCQQGDMPRAGPHHLERSDQTIHGGPLPFAHHSMACRELYHPSHPSPQGAQTTDKKTHAK